MCVQGTLAVDDLVFNITVVSYIPTEPLLDQARNAAQPRPFTKCLQMLDTWMQVQVASRNAKLLDAFLLANLGIQFNCSDSDSSDSGSDIGSDNDNCVSVSLTVDFVQRSNFSVTDDGVLTFLSPQARRDGYTSMLVFDKDGASTNLPKSIFYHLKVCLSDAQ
jgi:hypothetical protein